MAAVQAKFGSVLDRLSRCWQDCSAFKLWIGCEWRRFSPVLAIWVVSAFVLFATFRSASVLHMSRGIPAFVASRSLLTDRGARSASAPEVQRIVPSNLSAQLAASTTETYTTFGRRCANISRQSADQNTSTANADGSKYYLAALIANRVFLDDLFHMSSYDIKQWIEYMLYAGVEHIYWYDTAHDDSESQEAHLANYVRSGLLTYHRFHTLFPNSLIHGYHFEQDNTFRHFLENHRSEAKWVAGLDADEYPFKVGDKGRCFLRKAMEAFDNESVVITQVLVECLFFVGNAIQESEEAWVSEKYQRRKKETEGMKARPKPIFQSNLVIESQYESPHAMPMRMGYTVVADAERLRLNHYWGSRATEFGADTPELLSVLVPDSSIQVIVDDLKSTTGLTSRNASLLPLQ